MENYFWEEQTEFAESAQPTRSCVLSETDGCEELHPDSMSMAPSDVEEICFPLTLPVSLGLGVCGGKETAPISKELSGGLLTRSHHAPPGLEKLFSSGDREWSQKQPRSHLVPHGLEQLFPAGGREWPPKDPPALEDLALACDCQRPMQESADSDAWSEVSGGLPFDHLPCADGGDQSPKGSVPRSEDKVRDPFADLPGALVQIDPWIQSDPWQRGERPCSEFLKEAPVRSVQEGSYLRAAQHFRWVHLTSAGHAVLLARCAGCHRWGHSERRCYNKFKSELPSSHLPHPKWVCREQMKPLEACYWATGRAMPRHLGLNESNLLTFQSDSDFWMDPDKVGLLVKTEAEIVLAGLGSGRPRVDSKLSAARKECRSPFCCAEKEVRSGPSWRPPYPWWLQDQDQDSRNLGFGVDKAMPKVLDAGLIHYPEADPLEGSEPGWQTGYTSGEILNTFRSIHDDQPQDRDPDDHFSTASDSPWYVAVKLFVTRNGNFRIYRNASTGVIRNEIINDDKEPEDSPLDIINNFQQ